MITFDEARSIVEEAGIRKPASGTYYVAPWGWEDANACHVVAGAREWIVDGDSDLSFAPPLDDSVILVNKRSGTVSRVSYSADRARIEAMTPVGTGHPAWTLRHTGPPTDPTITSVARRVHSNHRR